jgi:CubicO group peptidase (beta-lactamase class C family)
MSIGKGNLFATFLCITWSVYAFGAEWNVLLPHIATSDGWTTFLTIQNAGESTGEVVVSIFDGSDEITHFTEHIPSLGVKRIELTRGSCGRISVQGDEIHFTESFIHSVDGGIASFPLKSMSSKTLHFLLPLYHASHLTWSGIAVFNPSQEETAIELAAYDQNGRVLAVAGLELEPISRETGMITDIFNGLDFRNVSRVVMNSELPCAGLVISGNENKQLLFTRAVDKYDTGDLILNHIATDWENWNNILIFDNTGRENVTTSLNLFAQGTLTGHEAVTIKAGQTKVIELNQYAQFNPDFGYVPNDSPSLSVRQSFVHSRQFGTAEFQISSMKTEELLLELTNDTELLNWHGLSLGNTSSEENRVTLWAYGDGKLLGSTELMLPEHTRKAILLTELFPALAAETDRILVQGEGGLSGLVIEGFNHERFLFSKALQLRSGERGMELNGLYYPGKNEDNWATITPTDAGYNPADIDQIMQLAENNNSSALIILYQGKIMAKRYWDIEYPSYTYSRLRLGTTEDGQPVEDVASVQKSICGLVAMLARDRGFLDVEKTVSCYIGKGWSQASGEQEGEIRVKHLLTMTSGLNREFEYEVPAGSKWYYNSSVYARTHSVLEAATQRSLYDITSQWLTTHLNTHEMKWIIDPDNSANQNRLSTTALDMARIGIMVSAGGVWRGNSLFTDPQNLIDAITAAQDVNSWYGYLWYINADGKTVMSAPHDMRSAQGKLKRKIYVVPSLELVVVRIGDDVTDVQFFEELWNILN